MSTVKIKDVMQRDVEFEGRRYQVTWYGVEGGTREFVTIRGTRTRIDPRTRWSSSPTARELTVEISPFGRLGKKILASMGDKA